MFQFSQVISAIAFIVMGIYIGYQRARLKHALLQRPPEQPSTDCRHEFVPIDTRPLEGPSLAYPHTALLTHCVRCHTPGVVIYPGEWKIADFLKKQSDKAWFEKECGVPEK